MCLVRAFVSCCSAAIWDYPPKMEMYRSWSLTPGFVHVSICICGFSVWQLREMTRTHTSKMNENFRRNNPKVNKNEQRAKVITNYIWTQKQGNCNVFPGSTILAICAFTYTSHVRVLFRFTISGESLKKKSCGDGQLHARKRPLYRLCVDFCQHLLRRVMARNEREKGSFIPVHFCVSSRKVVEMCVYEQTESGKIYRDLTDSFSTGVMKWIARLPSAEFYLRCLLREYWSKMRFPCWPFAKLHRPFDRSLLILCVVVCSAFLDAE